MAEREGFEPSILLKVYMISNHALSAAQPPLHENLESPQVSLGGLLNYFFVVLDIGLEEPPFDPGFLEPELRGVPRLCPVAMLLLIFDSASGFTSAAEACVAGAFESTDELLLANLFLLS